MTKVQCDHRKECGTPCGHGSPHQATREFDRSGVDCDKLHHCDQVEVRVRCNPVPVKVCRHCGADLAKWKETLGEEHRCFADPTDLTSPLRPPKGPDYYRCTKANICGIEDCTAAEDHTHDEPVHGPRECGFLLQKVECEKVGPPVPLKGVYFSGKGDRLHQEALRIMAESNGVPETESMTPTEWKGEAKAIIDEAIRRTLNYTPGRQRNINRATARIVALPRVRHEE